jgi:hypothetical protein
MRQYRLLAEKYTCLVCEEYSLGVPDIRTRLIIQNRNFEHAKEFLIWLKTKAPIIFDWIDDGHTPMSIDSWLSAYLNSYIDAHASTSYQQPITGHDKEKYKNTAISELYSHFIDWFTNEKPVEDELQKGTSQAGIDVDI